LGIYFHQDVDGIVARLLSEQLEDGGWNCEAERGSVRSSFATTINVLEGLLAHERATGGSAESVASFRSRRRVPSPSAISATPISAITFFFASIGTRSVAERCAVLRGY
jgi:hypothetical protein